MKTTNWLILFLLLLSTGISAQNNTITGFLRYDNNIQSLITDSTVVHLYQGNVSVYSVNVNNDGSYVFNDIPDGTYTLKAVCSKVIGGLNSVDALLIELHFVGVKTLTGLRLYVADVNGSGGTPGSVDALATARRFIHLLPSFMPPWVVPPGRPDWASQTFSLVVSGGNAYTQDIKLLCTGDVNGSYQPN